MSRTFPDPAPAPIPLAIRQPAPWRLATERPAGGWAQPGFDDRAWQVAENAFGTGEAPEGAAKARTRWRSPELWLRRTATLPATGREGVSLLVRHEGDFEVYLNGVLAASGTGRSEREQELPLAPAARAALHAGANTLAVHARRAGETAYLDVALAGFEPDPLPLPLPSGETLAFPGAEGFGRFTRGGRGGRVIEVTNLEDAGPGSLRAALEAEGPRTVVFRVSGTIALKSPLRIAHSFCTVAGQTAPGDGICLKNYALTADRVSDVVVRYLRMRPGDEAAEEGDALSFTHVSNSILDHCSMSWSTDSVCDVTKSSGLVTVQWCLISEALYQSVHAKGAHSMAAGFDGKGAGGSSYHHNLLASCNSRMPRIDAYAGPDGEALLADVRNNVVYNWYLNSGYGAEHARLNWVGNYSKPGPATPAAVRGRIFGPSSAFTRLFAAGNVVEGAPEVTADNWRGIHCNQDATPAVLRVDRPFPVAPVATQPAAAAYEAVLRQAGASLRRDAVDRRIVEEVRTGTVHFSGKRGPGTGILDSPPQVGGWPELKSGAPEPDTDHDGMPDRWETAHGLDPTDPADGALAGEEGYTNLERYLNELADSPTPAGRLGGRSSPRH